MGIDAQMLVKTRIRHTPSEVRALAVDLHEAFGGVVDVCRPGQWDWLPNGRHCLEVVEEYQQDGPSEFPEAGEQFIEVYLTGRYYGIDYERGPITEHIMVAMWLEARIPDARVFYGGDSSGVIAEPFGPEQRAALFRHFATKGHRPYRNYFDHGAPDRPTCDFCNEPMTQHGFGGNFAAWNCRGCGLKMERRGNEAPRVVESKS